MSESRIPAHLTPAVAAQIEHMLRNRSSAHLTPAQLAERWGVAERTLDRQRVTGEGPRWCRVGPRKILYPITEVIRWEEQRLYTSRAAEMVAKGRAA